MPVLYADIIVDISSSELDRIFQYSIPAHLQKDIAIGTQVEIPFGRGNRQVKGYVVGISDQTSYDPEKVKAISDIINDELAVESQLIRLASMIREAYGATMLQALKTVVPVKKQVRGNEKKIYRCRVSEQALTGYIEKTGGNQRLAQRRRLLELFMSRQLISKDELIKKLKFSQSTIDACLRDGILKEEIESAYRKPVQNVITDDQDIQLNESQRQVITDICTYTDRVHLIHGITGSGKTQVYIELIDHVISQGKQVVVLIPEIALTMQTVARFYGRFGDRVSIMNSRLSQGERYDQYLRAKRGDIDIVVGPRSALFMPFPDLGMIIIDEEHDGAYKSEKMPKYHAREVAIWRAEMTGGKVVLGSATPSVASYSHALAGRYRLHEMNNRAVALSQLPQVSVVDLKEEFKLKNKKIFSRLLHEKVEQRLQNKEQVILFLNRRGYAGFISCRSCGHVIKCKHCDISMTAHTGGQLKCHYCGSQEMIPKTCPECGSEYIAKFGTGTQKVEELVASEFPQARVLRLDRDSASKKHDMDKILQSFKNHEADILVGTQMIVKGHDFPNVTLVGILAADLSMFSSDFMASERTFQLLTQAAGRAGRADKPGEVVIQTYNPDHFSIVTAAQQDYRAFYEQEIIYRKLVIYKPVVHIMVILVESANEVYAQKGAEGIRKDILRCLKEKSEEADVIGPAAAFIAKGKDIYRRVIYMKHENKQVLVDVKDYLEIYMEQAGYLKYIAVQFDMDPMSVY